MSRRLAAGAVLLTIATGIAASGRLVAAPDRVQQESVRPLYSPPRELVLYGHIKSLVRTARGFALRFDPAFWLTGQTANRAAVEDGVIQPGDVVPNDYYIRDEGHRLLTYRVPVGARVTVLTRGPISTRITVSELAAILKGRNPRHRALFDRQNGLGYWIGVRMDVVRTLDQQYQP
jgi:hypothetical protein